MRLLADENVPYPLIRLLRERGHDVLSARESLRGLPDVALLKRAQADERLILTLDKDFGELAFHFDLPARSGVILFRGSGQSPEADNAHLATVLESRDDWSGLFATVTDKRIRLRQLKR